MVLKREYDHINSNGSTNKLIRRVTVYGSRDELLDAIDNLWLEFPNGVFNPIPGGIEIMMFEGGSSEFDVTTGKRANGTGGRGDQDAASGCEREDQASEGSREGRPSNNRNEKRVKTVHGCKLRGLDKKA
jgi:hypothetical protein